MALRLASLTRPELIFPDLPGEDRDAVLRELAGRIAKAGVVRDPDDLFQKLWEREQLGSTGIGSGIAIPHCKLPGLSHGIVAIGLAPGGVDFGAADGQPVRLLFLVLSPSASPGEHLQVLATISRWVKAGRAERILELREPTAVVELLEQEGG
ncbi:MAG TPA: PTS sugar transporter subunit IIA [Thermoanaerobaculia bacterium]|nr:PTS sugar transporter subunit IIA [Thermoanaerobaculia bacterium]